MREWQHWELEDPAAVEGTDEETLAKFRKIRDQLDAMMRRWLVQHDVALAELHN
jgi:arsenate reductase